jgi:hypothetical protein
MQQELRHLLSLKPFSQFVIELTDGDKFIIYGPHEVGPLGKWACAVLQDEAIMILPYRNITKVRMRAPGDNPHQEWMERVRERQKELQKEREEAKE